MKLHPEVQALSDVMHDLEGLLRAQGQVHWADKVGQSLRSIDQSDAHGLRSFLALFGGMGSLNDLVLGNAAEGKQRENDRLDNLRDRAWTMASRLASES